MVSFLLRLIGIRKEQTQLLLAAFSIVSLLSINYYILRSLRNTLAVTFSSRGAELLPAIQFWALLPVTILVIFGVSALMRRTSQARAFIFTTLSFNLFFILYALFLFPIRSELHAASHIEWLNQWMPSLGLLVDNWTLALYYVIAELWKVAVLSVLFFGFLNQRLSISSAKGLYSPILLGASIGGLLAGPLTVWCSSRGAQFCDLLEMDKWQCSFLLMSIALAAISGVALLGFSWLRRHLAVNEETKSFVDKPMTITLLQSIKTLLASPYLLSLAMIVIFEYVAYYLFEIFFLDLLHKVHPDPNAYCAYNGQLIFWSSLLTTCSALIVAPWMLKRFSWRVPALILPTSLAVLSLPFFWCAIFQETLPIQNLSRLLSLTPLQLSLTFGSLLFCIARAAKSTVFDASKELAFIPLSSDMQSRGKLAIDGICSRGGCSLAACVNQTLTSIFPTLEAGLPLAAVLVFGSISLMIRGVLNVNRDLETAKLGPTSLVE